MHNFKITQYVNSILALQICLFGSPSGAMRSAAVIAVLPHWHDWSAFSQLSFCSSVGFILLDNIPAHKEGRMEEDKVSGCR